MHLGNIVKLQAIYCNERFEKQSQNIPMMKSVNNCQQEQ